MTRPPEKPTPWVSDPASNRLASSTSPYLRQHADNPVHWFGWGPDALDRAVRDDRPILLSVGYSACHWCHVMAHESFEDKTTAREMNEWFINIKVDREERPDVDALYQKVLALMGQGGGWPLTVFLMPDQRPFYGGTYFPRQAAYGRPSFRQVLASLHDAWESRRAEVEDQAGQFVEGFAELARAVDIQADSTEGEPGVATGAAQRHAALHLIDRLDATWGGFGRAPKFPNVPALELVLDQARREVAGHIESGTATEAVQLTLERMWRGGLYDHLRGGFARYSVDREWLVPHFEKMLYDNALLLGLYAQASVLWPKHRYLRGVVTETIDYLLADMRDPQGLFYSATDADSEGVEGKYFCWTPDQLIEALGDQDLAERVAIAYGVQSGGNFEDGMSILHLPSRLGEVARRIGTTEDALERELSTARACLLTARSRRVPPLRDEKVLTAWYALLVSGLCLASAAALAWGERRVGEDWRDLATATAQALWEGQVADDGAVYRARWQGQPHTRGYLDDVAALGRACLDVYELTLSPMWLDRAAQMAVHAMAHYARVDGGFFFAADDAEPLLERAESQHDSPTPSGLALMVELLARLDAAGRGPEGGRVHLEVTLHRFRAASSEPFAFAGLLRAAAWAGPEAIEVTLEGRDSAQVESLWSVVQMERQRSPWPIGLTFELGADAPRAQICRGQTCGLPLGAPEELRAGLTDPPS